MQDRHAEVGASLIRGILKETGDTERQICMAVLTVLKQSPLLGQGQLQHLEEIEALLRRI